MSKSTKTTATGVSLLGVLQIIFIVLKVCGLIDWSWWVVFIPVWIDLSVVAVFLFIYFIVYAIAYFYSRHPW